MKVYLLKGMACFGNGEACLTGVGNTAARAAFVIDKNGVVQYSEQTPTPKDLPNFESIKATPTKLK